MSAEQVKQGFKRTEAGVIPEDWKVVPIASLIERNSRITYGVVQPGKDDPRGVLFVRGGDVYDGTIDLKNLRRITLAVSKQYARTQLRGGELLISLVGFPGECAIAPPDLKGANLARQVALVRFSKNRDFDPEYICHLLRSNAGKRLLLKDAFGSAQQVINLKDVNKLEVPLPSRCGEQKAIATALSDVDTLLAQVDQLIAKKRDLKQAAMQQLLTGQTRLPGFSGVWEVKMIREFTDCTTGGTPNTSVPAYWSGDIRWMSSGELNLKTVTEVEGRITELGIKNSSTKMVPTNCVLVGLAGQGKTRGTVAINEVELCTNQSIAAILPNPLFVSKYLFYNLESRYEELRMLSTGDGGRGGLNLKIIRSVTVPFPTIDEQTAIATVLSDIDAELTALEARRDKTRTLKQGMMQELLTGRIRLV